MRHAVGRDEAVVAEVVIARRAGRAVVAAVGNPRRAARLPAGELAEVGPEHERAVAGSIRVRDLGVTQRPLIHARLANLADEWAVEMLGVVADDDAPVIV